MLIPLIAFEHFARKVALTHGCLDAGGVVAGNHPGNLVAGQITQWFLTARHP